MRRAGKEMRFAKTNTKVNYRVVQENCDTSNLTSDSCCVYHIFFKFGSVVADIISFCLVFSSKHSYQFRSHLVGDKELRF
jgi:hypothetical protein